MALGERTHVEEEGLVSRCSIAVGLCPDCPRLAAGKGSAAQALLAGGRDPELTCVSSQTLGALSEIRRIPGRKQGPFPENTERDKTRASLAAVCLLEA